VLITAGKDPVIRTPERQLAKWGAPVRFLVAASSAGRSPIRLSASALPAGAGFDAVSGVFSWTAAESQQGSHRITFTATDSAGASSVAQTIVEVDGGKPASLALMNAATRANDLACSPGSLAVITGKWLTESAPAIDLSAAERELAGSRVKINGDYARLVSVAPTEIQFVCPDLLAGTPMEILVETRSGAAEPLRSVMRAATPGIFSVDGSGRGPAAATIDATPAFAAVRSARSNGQPAQPGDRLLIRATGLGSEGAPSYPLVQLGELYVEVESMTPYPGHAGVVAIQVKVPAGTNAGNDIPVRLHLPQPGRSPIGSNTVTVAVEAVRR
jgi:uncharacterized protein (TIGR03437 family)